ncbi:hypothetical protein ONE63_003676 [Megalurothrips usitatus]|uniref:mitogen-activated protein kinase kinase n=1 Tax=Megalurothrips usitatus TaxID=439358 RepID=A0AAV7X791_9NEOP|nr:hypothetical protein ONE63_003676 [Megalurothrips usitatus]
MSTPSLEDKIISLQQRMGTQRGLPLSRPGNDSQSSGRPSRPNRLLPTGTPRSRPNLLPGLQQPPQRSNQEDDTRWQEIIKRSGLLKISGQVYRTQVNDLEHLGELGNGTCGHVVKMLHKPSSVVIAVKQMRRSGNNDENKRITMDIEVVLKSDDCPYIVQCVGCFILEADVWICMELMDTCFDKLLKRLRKPIPEHILGKVTVATVKALDYLKETHGVIHRDVKPSNILLDKRGNVKLCDFGISGRLVDSKAQTRSAGCAAYMAPERIDPPDPTHPDYDIRADVWSLGITLVELATGVFPYSNCLTDFEVLTKVLTSEPPRLPMDQNFSDEFRDFVNCCLTKDYKNRPKYRKLLQHPFITKYETTYVNVAEWYESELNPTQKLSHSSISQVAPPSSNATAATSGSALNSPVRR